MALINCPECGHQMSDTAKQCPNCGYKQSNSTPFNLGVNHWFWGLVIIMVSLIWMIIAICIGSNWSQHIILDSDSFLCGMAMFALGFIGLYFGCKLLRYNKALSKIYLKLFYALSAVCLIGLGVTLICLDAETYRQYYSYLHNSENTSSENSNGAVSNNESSESLCSWSYTTDIDDLTGETTGYNAHIASTNSITSKYGTDRLVIQLSYNGLTGKPTNMFGLAFKKGDCRFANNNSQGFHAVFDNGEVDETWTLCNGGNNKSIVMISDGFSRSEERISSFINKLKNAKTCKIQVNIDGIGMKTFTFNCEGLNWNY